MASLHCTPRPRSAAFLSTSFRREKLCFCTEELGSESLSNLSRVAGAETQVCAPGASQALHGSLQGDVGDVAPSVDGTCSSFQCIDISLQKYETKGPAPAPAGGVAARAGRTFPPPIPSLVSDRQIMRTRKFNGRFVLQRVSISNSPFSAIRENGRLKLITASSSGEHDDHENPQEEIASVEEDKQRENRLMPTRGDKVGSAAFSKISMWVPLYSTNMKLFGHGDTAILNDYYLPALRLLLLTAAGAGVGRKRSRSHQVDSISLTTNGKGKPEGKSGCPSINLVLGSTHIMSSDDHNHEGSIHIAARSPQGTITSIDELLFLVLEMSCKGTLVLQAKDVFFPPTISSTFASINSSKPLDLRLESTCH